MIMQKPNQTSIDATVEVTDHEQGDQKLYLEKDSETLLWSMTKAEVDLHSTPPPSCWRWSRSSLASVEENGQGLRQNLPHKYR